MPGYFFTHVDDESRPVGPLRIDASRFVCGCGVLVVAGTDPASPDIRDQSDAMQCSTCWRNSKRSPAP